MRFIHTADWHLGRLFHGQHLTEDQAYLLMEFLRMVTETKAEAVIIAGDIYDRAVPPTEAVELFDEVLAKLLLEKKVRVFYIAGNHDSAQRLDFGRRIMAGQGLFVRGNLTPSLEPVIVEDAYGPVYFQLFPYMEPAGVRAVFGGDEGWDFDAATGRVVEAGAACIPQGVRSVAVAHAFLAGGQVSDSERPLSVGGSSNVSPRYYRSFSYTALGHLHNPQRAGADHIRYSGSLMKYSFEESSQQKSLAVVDLDAQGQTAVELLPLLPKHDMRRIRGYFDDILRDRDRYPASDDYLLAELLDTDTILDVHGKLETIFPNLMQIDRPNLNYRSALADAGQVRRQQSEAELFAGFFQDMTGEALTEEQRSVFAETADGVFRREREGKI